MVPMIIVRRLAQRYRHWSGSIVLAYIAETLTGPLLYTLLPAYEPAYAFRANWLDPPALQAEVVRLSGMPNSFPRERSCGELYR
jgi:hypothetical protein